MKICIIGNSGHANQFIKEGTEISGTEFCAYCASYQGENMDHMKQTFYEKNIKSKEFSDYESMIGETKPDVLIVDSMFCDHYKFVRDALLRGIHVFCEKPLALTLDELEELEQIQERHTTECWAMQTLRYKPWTYMAKKLLDQGAIGEIRMINCQKSYKLGKRAPFFRNRKESGGMIPWVAIHGIDAIQFLCPNQFLSAYAVQSNCCNQGNGDLEMTAICVFELEHGVVAHVNADYYRPDTAKTHGDDRIRIVGTEGILEIIGSKLYLLNRENDGSAPLEQIPFNQVPAIFGDFLRSLSGSGEGILNSKQSLISTRMALMARDSAECGRILYVDEHEWRKESL